MPGAAQLMLIGGVIHLDPAPAAFDAMIKGWKPQQMSRMLSASTIEPRLDLVRRFEKFVGTHPWKWNPSDVEDWTSSLLGGDKPRSHSAIGGYQNSLRLFLEHITDPRYGWLGRCQELFGENPQQICHKWNAAEHLSEFEARPSVRPLTCDELEAFFARCDEPVDEIRGRGRKGTLVALRDAQMFKTYNAWGLRRNEGVSLDLVDLRANPYKRDWGIFGSIQVRYGKAVKGSPPRRRTALLVP